MQFCWSSDPLIEVVYSHTSQPSYVLFYWMCCFYRNVFAIVCFFIVFWFVSFSQFHLFSVLLFSGRCWCLGTTLVQGKVLTFLTKHRQYHSAMIIIITLFGIYWSWIHVRSYNDAERIRSSVMKTFLFLRPNLLTSAIHVMIFWNSLLQFLHIIFFSKKRKTPITMKPAHYVSDFHVVL